MKKLFIFIAILMLAFPALGQAGWSGTSSRELSDTDASIDPEEGFIYQYNSTTELWTPVDSDLLIEEKETERIIRESIGGLSSKCQEVFTMSRDDLLSNKEIAQHLNISVRTVETHIHKALKSIKKNLKQIYFW